MWYTSVAAGGGRRRVIVTHPRDGARHPAVLLVGGIGCFSVDSPSGIDPYRDLLYHLTRRGYATVRVEKSGVGDSQGDPCAGVDFQTEFSGYAAALGSMKHYPFVDSTRVFVFGHSIGGIEGPLLVSRDSSGPPVLGIAVLSTVGIGWYEYELANSRRQNRLSGATPDSVEESMKRKTRCAYRLLIARESSVGIIASDPECKPYFVYPASDAYMQQVAAINLGATWSGVHAPALVMYPGSDFITSRDEHLQLVDAINAMHPGSATFADVPGMDHHLAAEPSQQAAYADPTPPAIRPYFGATLEPIVDAWLDRIALRGATAPSRAQTATDSGRFTIYKLQHPVGAETWSRVTTGDHSTLSVSWAFRYIGSNVRLNASLASAPDGAPRQLEAHGQTSTLTDVDLSVALAPDSAIVVERGVRRVVHASRAAFPIFHYPPVAIEEALFRYCCLRQTRPAPARLLPSGQATFAQRGTDTLRGPSGTSVVLRRYCVSGLLWGRQSMWATADGRIVAVVNGDAELDRFEAVRAGYEHLLPDFVRGAVRDGLADLEAAARHAPPSRIGAYAIVGARIIDGTGAPPIADGVVIIRDGRIEAVGPAGRVLVPANLPREDARGKTIIPGLWDMHVHFEQVEWPAAQLAAGVTTARDMGNELELATGLRDAISGSRVPGPRLEP